MAHAFFEPRLVNGRAGDPALHVELLGEGRAFLFDLGRLERLRPAEILRVTDVFVSHTHVDHFIGFDHFLRIRLGHGRGVRLFGPEGFLANVEGKLAGYTWNLTAGQAFSIEAVELRADRRIRQRFRCADAFRPAGDAEEESLPEGPILSEARVRVSFAVLDHRIPCLAFAAREADRHNVDVEAMAREGLSPGPWLGALKRAAARGADPETPIQVGGKTFPTGELTVRLIRRTPGEKLAYVADAGYNEKNAEKIVALARGADLFFCEGGVLDEDAEKARENYHLTAREAGALARRAGARKLTTFHFSPRYLGREEALKEEAARAFHEGTNVP